MRNLLFASAFVGISALTMWATPSNAANNAWCATTITGQAVECNYLTEAQCAAFVSGVGGTCATNPSLGEVRAQMRPAGRQPQRVSAPVNVPKDVYLRP